MQTAPKSVRLHVVFLGRTNVGKSSVINFLTGQSVSITSPVPGTTTDVVEKAMEMLPLGPVLLIDTAGLDDKTELGKLRIEKTRRALEAADVAALVVEPDCWTKYEEKTLEVINSKGIPAICIVNKIDLKRPSENFIEFLKSKFQEVIAMDTVTGNDNFRAQVKEALIKVCPKDFVEPPPLVADLVIAGDLVVLVVPIDLQAPKGRLILPQVQTIRELLDADCAVVVVKERELAYTLTNLKVNPKLIICDSQVVQKTVADAPPGSMVTTFSILMARQRGDLKTYARGAATIEALKPGDKILIAEACTHHPIEDDIGRVKIPRWFRQYVGGELEIDVVAGKDFPEDLSKYKLVIHCGGCMLNRRAVLARISRCQEVRVPITNYGVAISFLHGVLHRTLQPFPSAWIEFQNAIGKFKSNQRTFINRRRMAF